MDSGSPAAEHHRRYLLQAEWTFELRDRLIKQLQLHSAARLLEVGSGTGAISESVANSSSGRVTGIDIDPVVTRFARKNKRSIDYVLADGFELPFGERSFDAAFCHFLFLWVADPGQVLTQMRRVVKPGGWLIAFAEPDYGGRIDYPEELDSIGRLQARALRTAGAEPQIGRRLRGLFAQAGLKSVTSGVLGGEWWPGIEEQVTHSEWETLERDVRNKIPSVELERLQTLDREAWQDQTRILFVPTFYAFGQVR